MSAALALKTRLAQPKIVAAPGAPDSLTARLVQQAGFDATYMTGFGATSVRLGTPDLGLLTLTEMADHARNMVRAVDIPVIADADTGYGGPLNISRTVEEYLQAGVAALHLEDQVAPKRCGQLAGIRLTPADEAALRLKAAVTARGRNDLLIIGRTDALPVAGINEAADRAKRYQDAGIDLTFVDGVKTCAEVEAIATQVTGPKVVSLVDGTDAATLTREDLQDMGFDIVLYAVTALFAQAHAGAEALAALKSAGRPKFSKATMGYEDFCQAVDLIGHQAFAGMFETSR